MKQLGLGLNLSTKKTRKREFLEEMERVVPWAALVQIVSPYYPKAKTGRPPFCIETMLRIHYKSCNAKLLAGIWQQLYCIFHFVIFCKCRNAIMLDLEPEVIQRVTAHEHTGNVFFVIKQFC